MKTTMIWMLAGALAGIAIASWLVPPALSWYSEPGGLPNGQSVQSLVVVPDVIRFATGKLIRGQLIGAFVGGLGGLVLGIVLSRRGRAGAVAARS
jgi:hypothetical protein